MSSAAVQEYRNQFFDVVICGGGLAGLTLARQLRRSLPNLRVLVAERTTRPLPEATHKVGESTVELGSRYLQDLGLREYLSENHLFKFGPRFYIGSGQLPIEERSEIGASREPIVPSYQLDRGILENDLRAMIVEDGAVLLEGVKLSILKLSPDDEDHEIELVQLARDGNSTEVPQSAKDTDGSDKQSANDNVRIRCRWLIDATGRVALLRKRLKLTRGTKHRANASWFRVEGRVDINDLVSPDNKAWHKPEWAPHRWRSTNHLMGPGYWVWIIPLSSGKTSIGIVVHDSHHPFEAVRSLENSRAFLEKHEPIFASLLEKYPILDFGCLKNYSYNTARSWSGDRWAIVGEAGAFADPLFSPGTDFIAYANSFTVDIIRRDGEGEGENVVDRARELSLLFRSLVGSALDVFRGAADVYGHPDAFLAKVYWDNFSYWSYPCQLYLQGLYKITASEMPELTPLGRRFAELIKNMQRLFTAWAGLVPPAPRPGIRTMPGYPSVLIDAHLALQEEWNPTQAVEYVRMRLVESEEMAGELLLRAMDEVGNENVDALVQLADVFSWGIRISDRRVAANDTIGLARRRALPPLARDLERTLGRPPKNINEATIRRVLDELIAPPCVLSDGDSGHDKSSESLARNSKSAGVRL